MSVADASTGVGATERVGQRESGRDRSGAKFKLREQRADHLWFEAGAGGVVHEDCVNVANRGQARSHGGGPGRAAIDELDHVRVAGCVATELGVLGSTGDHNLARTRGNQS